MASSYLDKTPVQQEIIDNLSSTGAIDFDLTRREIERQRKELEEQRRKENSIGARLGRGLTNAIPGAITGGLTGLAIGGPAGGLAGAGIGAAGGFVGGVAGGAAAQSGAQLGALGGMSAGRYLGSTPGINPQAANLSSPGNNQPPIQSGTGGLAVPQAMPSYIQNPTGTNYELEEELRRIRLMQQLQLNPNAMNMG